MDLPIEIDMKTRAGSIVVALTFVLLWPRPAAASGMTPCTMFTDRSGFHIGDAYAAADLVVIGQVVPKSALKLHIIKKIKGSEGGKEVSLTVPTCTGTACSGGFSVAPGVDLLFLLRRMPDGVYDGVAGNGNYSCPTVFEVKDGAVKIGGRRVRLKSLKRFFESKPDPIPVF